MKKLLTTRNTALFVFATLLASNSAYAHQGLFSHATIHQPVLHLLFHSMVLVLLGVAVFFISRWWLKRKTDPELSRVKTR